jgi:hypothetical protein
VDFRGTVTGISNSDPDAVKAAIFSAGKAEGVLVTDLFGNLRANPCDLANFTGQERKTARILREVQQHLGIPITIVLIEDSDRINDDAGIYAAGEVAIRQARVRHKMLSFRRNRTLQLRFPVQRDFQQMARK